MVFIDNGWTNKQINHKEVSQRAGLSSPSRRVKISDSA